MLRLIITGTGGPLADPKRFGPSQIILIDDKKLAFDRGYGFVRQLVNLGIRPSEVDHLFITHMHYDHVCDLPSLLFTAWHETPRKRLQIYGPEGIKEFIQNGIKRAYELDIRSNQRYLSLVGP